MDWGIQGLHNLLPQVRAVVLVDVLSFTTAVEVATTRGAAVFPYPARDGTEIAYASSREAVVAADRREGGEDRSWSLSPASLMTIPAGTQLVLPSPNGSTLAFEAAEGVAVVLAGCLRNASAVASVAAAAGTPIGVVAAGERWHSSDGSLRPAIEDLLGAGAVIAGLAHLACSPEARAALAVFRSARVDLPTCVRTGASGRELAGRGFLEDVQIASEHDVSVTVPTLIDGAFRGHRHGPDV